MSPDLESRLSIHLEESSRRLNGLEEKTDTILNNHLVHLNAGLVEVRTDTKWIKKFLWAVLIPAIGGVVAGVINLL